MAVNRKLLFSHPKLSETLRKLKRKNITVGRAFDIGFDLESHRSVRPPKEEVLRLHQLSDAICPPRDLLRISSAKPTVVFPEPLFPISRTEDCPAIWHLEVLQAAEIVNVEPTDHISMIPPVGTDARVNQIPGGILEVDQAPEAPDRLSLS